MLLVTSCPVCRQPGPAPCAACAVALTRAPPGPVPAVLAYDGVGRRLVQALKYRNGRAAVPVLAASMAALVDGSAVEVVTWAPTSAARRRRRGYDQAELLARGVARHLRVPARPLLRRGGHGPQTGRTRAERLGAAPLFRARSGVAGRRVLVVDDVVTTGATLASAVRALEQAGAAEVIAVAAAATP